jgi:hypothetical protein
MERPFYSQPIQKSSHYYKFAIRFMKENNIKYRIRWKTNRWGGFAVSDRGYVDLRIGEDKYPISIRKFLSLVFHECSHVLNSREGKFADYHRASGRMTKKLLKALVRTGVRAEKYTDWRASRLMAKHFPNIPYFPGYDAEGVARFKRYQVAAWKADLEIMNG